MEQPFFDIKEEDSKIDYARLIISPLPNGFGHTLGNSLRRVLLTSLQGAAIVSVRIAGVKHQFSTLKGMSEDIVDFVLNLKKVRVAYTGEKLATGTIEIVADKYMEVKASDIKVDSSVKIVNPDFVIARLNEGAKLEAKIEISTGYGYSDASDRATGEIGLIPLDASFSPVVRVNYRVEETRVGRITNYDRLVMEIWTNGTISPREALISAANQLMSFFRQIVSPELQTKDHAIQPEKENFGPTAKLSVEEIGLPTRVANALIKNGYETVEDLIKAKRSDLAKVRNLGEKSVKIIEAALAERNLGILDK
ncbi:MAG: DNA-directed RNA polymerase subunit alpha [Patescibacteria group bacterium]|nr:DNA-directed RNA polymerase subunit alpha [Patescibacteria group bacterium]